MHPWWKIVSQLEQVQSRFSANLRIIHDYGAMLLVLLIENNSNRTVWVEEAVVSLTELDADWQTSTENTQAILGVRQSIGPHEILELSPVNTIYEAAGRPQGKYSSIMHIDVRYRVDDKWCHKTLDAYKIKMGALMLLGLRHLRWYEMKLKVDFPKPHE